MNILVAHGIVASNKETCAREQVVPSCLEAMLVVLYHDDGQTMVCRQDDGQTGLSTRWTFYGVRDLAIGLCNDETLNLALRLSPKCINT